MIIISLAPALPLAGAQEASGFLVFRDTQPVGPELDVVFHAVVPEGVTVVSTGLHLFGTTGVLPVAAETAGAGAHAHALEDSGVHAHMARDSQGHSHQMDATGEHDHSAFVYTSNALTDAVNMSVTLSSHDHNTNVDAILPYDFPPIISNGHNHTAQPHSHTTLIVSSGEHEHTTQTGGGHDHVLEVSGEHQHVSDVVPDHSHDLRPGTYKVVDGTRPSDVIVTVTQGQSSNVLPSVPGSTDTDWSKSLDLMGEIGPGITEVRLASTTTGSLEYVLVVEVDAAYGVLTGHSVLGPGGNLEIPIAAPLDTVAATVFLFGEDLPSTASVVEDAGNHTHASSVDGDHNHSMAPVVGHTHTVSGGDHDHEGFVGKASPPTDTVTPTWSLPPHRHSLTWTGSYITNVGSFNYGTVESGEHFHTVVGHDHPATINVSGNHTHDLSVEGVHTHVVGPSSVHSHATSEAADHMHSLVYHPHENPTGGPTGVNANLDGVDITADNGGPWALTEAPVTVPLGIASWSGPHFLNLTANTDGEVEWVVLLKLGLPVLISTVHGLAGDLAAHIPVPGTVASAQVGVRGSPYVMPQAPTTEPGGSHSHITTMDGGHIHTVEVEGAHVHQLEVGGAHIHVLTLNDTVVEVLDANGTVDLDAHSHAATQGFLTSSASSVVGDTGDHMHATLEHDHEMVWAQGGTHVHIATPAGNHTHATYLNGSHAHTMAGNGHGHAVNAGVHYDPAFPSPSAVDIKLGPSDPGIQLPGGGARWWDSFEVDAAEIAEDDLLVLTASSATNGTLSVVVWFPVDSDPPEPVLVEAPDWARPGDMFDVVVGVPSDIDPDTAVLEIGPVDVLEDEFDEGNLTITFLCQAPLSATEGRYDINITSSDVVGNQGTTVLGTMGVDGTPPELGMSLGDPHLEEDGDKWVTQATPVNLTITDALSGPDGLEYAFSVEGPWTDYDPVNDTILEGLSDGPQTLHYRGIDVAGNVAEEEADLRLDSTPPSATLVVEPSVPGGSSKQVLASPNSLVSFVVSDGDGIGALSVEYRTMVGGAFTEWRTFDRPFPVMTVTVSNDFGISWRTTDRLGNVDAMAQDMEVLVDYTHPIPSPEGDLFLPDFATESPLTIKGRVPGAVARFHYRVDTGSEGVMDIEPDTTFSFVVDLEEGPNVLIYALEDPVGNTSPWVVAGTITLDTESPTVTGSDPVNGTRTLPTEKPTVAVHFSEPVRSVTVKAFDFETELDVEVTVHPGNSSASIAFTKDLPATSYIDVELTFSDMAGHPGNHKLRMRTGESAQNQALGYIFGLIAGLVIGALLVYFITFKRKDEESPSPHIDEMGVRSSRRIVSPDSSREWGDELEDVGEGEPEDEEEVEGETEPDEGEEEGPDDEDVEGEVEPDEEEDETPEDDEWEEDEPTTSEDDTPEDDDVEAEPEEEGAEEVPDDLADEIDKLLEDATGDEDAEEKSTKWRHDVEDEEADDLPDPDAATVDPGARF